ncbi:hypothetical protein [Calothrix sp. NIES-2100]|uniref:hypothetical protein n=1 Tax=Calothrix sp. NIES-2100 TaxID=1954172 RepID=UPI0030DAAE2F
MSKVSLRKLFQTKGEILEPLIPVAKSGGRKPEVNIWQLLNAVFSVLCEDICPS